MNEAVKEIKNDLDFARGVFDYTLNPNQCGLLLDYINQLEQHIRDINQNVKDSCWYPDVGYANMSSIEVMELVQLLNKIDVGNELYWDDDLQNLYNELTKERK